MTPPSCIVGVVIGQRAVMCLDTVGEELLKKFYGLLVSSQGVGFLIGPAAAGRNSYLHYFHALCSCASPYCREFVTEYSTGRSFQYDLHWCNTCNLDMQMFCLVLMVHFWSHIYYVWIVLWYFPLFMRGRVANRITIPVRNLRKLWEHIHSMSMPRSVNHKEQQLPSFFVLIFALLII